MVTTHTTCFNVMGLHILATWCSYLLSMILMIHSNYCTSLNCINQLASEKKTTHCIFLWRRNSTFIWYLDELDFKGSNQIQTNQWRWKSGYRKTRNISLTISQSEHDNRTLQARNHVSQVCVSFICCPGIISSWEGKNEIKWIELNWIELNWIELNGIWVRALPGPLHVVFRTGPMCPMFCTKLQEPCSFSKVPDGPYT